MAARSVRPRSLVVRSSLAPSEGVQGPNCKLVYTKKCEDDDENCKVEVEEIQETQTDFIAETLLPTHGGYFRVRAYRNWVSYANVSCYVRPSVGP